MANGYNTNQLIGTLTPNRQSLKGTLDALRIIPIVPMRKEVNEAGGYTVIIGGINGK